MILLEIDVNCLIVIMEVIVNNNFDIMNSLIIYMMVIYLFLYKLHDNYVDMYK
jgi:hypothetical protein